MDQTPKIKTSAALRFIFVTIFIDVLGLGIILPVMPKLLQSFGHFDISTASKYNGWLTLIYATMQLVFASIMGSLSDRYGRRPVLLISLFGFSIDYMFMAFAPSLAWLFVGRFIAGVTGASTATATAYIADISTGHKRDANFGLVGAASGIGLILGVGLGGWLGEIDIKFPFMAAAGFAFLNGMYGLFVLPESLKPEHRRKFEWKRANPLGALIRVFTRHEGLAGLIGAILMVYTAQKAVEYMLSFFLYEKFNWSMHSVSLLALFIGLLLFAIQAGLIRYTIPKFGQRKNIIWGIIFYAVGLSLIAFTTQGWMVYIFMIPYCLGGISGPALQGYATNKVAKNEQGELQGAITIINSISVIVGPAIFSFLFSHYTNKNSGLYFPGAPFLLAAILMIISTFLAIKSFRNPVRKVKRKISRAH